MTEIAHKGALDDVFDRNLERRTQSSTIMDTFTKGALTLPRFVRQAAKFICKNMRDQFHKMKNMPELVDLPYPVSESKLAFFRSSRFASEYNKRKKARYHRCKTIPVYEEDKTRKHSREHKTFKPLSYS